MTQSNIIFIYHYIFIIIIYIFILLIYINNYRDWSRILVRSWIHKRHPIPRPRTALYWTYYVGALMFYLIRAWLNDWVNNREACKLRHHRAHYDVIVMGFFKTQWVIGQAILRMICTHKTYEMWWNIMRYFLHSTLVLSIYTNVGLTPSILMGWISKQYPS